MAALLTIELVPAGQWGSNLRSVLPRSQWDRLRKKVYADAGYRCEICGARGPRHPVECHEIWRYDDHNLIQHLDGLIALCPSCHEVKHFGRAHVMGRGPDAARHLMKVNSWGPDQTAEYIKASFDLWNWRSNRTWKLNVSWLDNN